MKKTALFLTAAAIMAILSGCCVANCYIDPAAPGTEAPEGYTAVATGKAVTDGIYLFNTWVLVAGNTNRPNTNDYAAWDDNVTERRNADMLFQNMKKAYKAEKLFNTKAEIESTGWFSLWIFWHRHITLEATGIRKK